MRYIHPKAYKGIRNTPTSQNVQKLFVEENCLKCSEFCGKEHDFTECKPLYHKCPQPIKYPALVNPEEFIKFESEE